MHTFCCVKTESKWICFIYLAKKGMVMGGSPGLVVTGWDTHWRGRRFESQHRILNWHIYRFFLKETGWSEKKLQVQIIQLIISHLQIKSNRQNFEFEFHFRFKRFRQKSSICRNRKDVFRIHILKFQYLFDRFSFWIPQIA